MNFQDIIKNLESFWSEYGCTILQPYTTEIGAGTLHPATVMSAINPYPIKISHVQPVIRPADGRYGDNPNRLYQHHQYQVLIKPSSNKLQEAYLASMERIGISPKDHDIQFIEDDWENPSIGAWGLGWEVVCNGMEITQFTYMQQVGGIDCTMIPGEIAYGLERIAMYIQDIDNVYDIVWDSRGTTYGDIFKRREYEFSKLALDFYRVDFLFRNFSESEQLCHDMIAQGLPYAAYDQCVKASHFLNLLDSRGALSSSERASYIFRVRKLASSCSSLYVSSFS